MVEPKFFENVRPLFYLIRQFWLHIWDPPNFWLGGGHVDVKLNVSVEELIRSCDPIIADIAT